MGLKRSFLATSRVPYERWPGGPPTSVWEAYNTYLIKTPRRYQEEPYSYSQGRLGVLWTRSEVTPWSTTTVNVLAAMNIVDWPGWAVTRWKFDGQLGRYLERANFSNMGNVATAIGRGFSYEPSGWVWAFGSDYVLHDAVVLDESTMSFDSSLGQILSSDFLTRDGGAVGGFQDMAVDRAADRLFARWTMNNRGQVSIYRLSTKTWLADIYAPNETAGIVLTHDGFVYLLDVADWILCYDFDGSLYNAFKNPRRENFPGGFCYGWDKFYKRLLFLGGVANATDGASRLRIRAYYPVPEAAILTPPIPRDVPRVGRSVVFVSHLAGEGAEPLGGRPAVYTGAASGVAVSDSGGDYELPVTPSAAGGATLSLSSDAPVTVPDPAEADEVIQGETLIADWIVPQNMQNFGPGGAVIPFTVRVSGAVAGALTMNVYPFTTGGGGSDFTGSGSNPADLEATLSLIPAKWWLFATVTDSLGHHGYSQRIAVYVGGASPDPPDTDGSAHGDFLVAWALPVPGAAEPAQPSTFIAQLTVTGAAPGVLQLTVNATFVNPVLSPVFSGSGSDPQNLSVAGGLHPQSWLVTAIVHDAGGNMGQTNTIAISVS